MAEGDYFDDPLLPQDPIGSAVGKYWAEKVGDVAPLVTPENVARFAQNPFEFGRDPAVIEPIIRNTPMESMAHGAFEKARAQIGNPTAVPLPPAAPLNVAMPGQPGQQPNPFAGVNPKDLAKLVNVGGSSQSRRTTQRTKGTKSMPGYDLGLDVAAGRAAGAAEDIGESQAKAAETKALEYGRHATALKARQQAFEADQKNVQAQVAAQEAKASALRAEVASMKVDPDRWMSSRTAGQKLNLSIAAGLSGFIQGFRGQTGPNAVVAMTQQMIDRDVALQSKAIARKGKYAAQEHGVVADLYRKLGDIRQAENQGRIMLNEAAKIKLDQIGMSAAAPIARANAQAASAALDQQIMGLKNRSFQQAQDKVTVSKSSSSSSRKAPLGTVLAKMAAAQAKAKGKPAEAGRVGGAPTEKIRHRLGAINSLRRDMVHFQKAYKNLGMPAGATGFWGGKGAAVQEMGARLMDKYVLTNPNASAAHIKLFKGLWGGKYATDKDLGMRLANVAAELDSSEQTMLEVEADAGINVGPYVNRAQKYRQLTRGLRGKH